MTTPELYVTDTISLISYFNNVFATHNRLSNHALQLLRSAFSPYEVNIKLSIPSVVFVEIFEKWLRSEEFSRKFYYEVFTLIIESPNVEIRPIDQEILEILLSIGGQLRNHDLHDKIILASAISLNCNLLSTDEKIIRFVEQTHVIPTVIN